MSLCRNLPHRFTEADSGQICPRWVSGQQCSGHKCPPDHWRAEGQQTPVLPEPVSLWTPWHSSSSSPHHLCTFCFRCSVHGQLPCHSILFVLFFFLPFILFYIDLWTHSCSSFLPWQNTSRSLYVTWFVELFSWSQCEGSCNAGTWAVVAVLIKPVKLFELKLCRVQRGFKNPFQWLPLDGAV